MINREEALNLLREHIDKENLIYHSLSLEAVMRALAKKFGEDEELWGLTGLLHDIDLGETADDLEKHGLRGAEILDGKLPPVALQAVKVHPGKLPRETLLDKALYCADPITGLIYAGALMRPSKSLADMTLKSLKKKYKDKRFAAGADRSQIDACSEIGLELGEFMEISLEAMRDIREDIGL